LSEGIDVDIVEARGSIGGRIETDEGNLKDLKSIFSLYGRMHRTWSRRNSFKEIRSLSGFPKQRGNVL
jgi:monoamine oxidase